jgi:hypothetical protein
MQAGGVSEIIDHARRWSGFVCPDCRFVFRVPRDHDGKGIVCPSCRRLMQIPVAGDSPPPLHIAPSPQIKEDVSGKEQPQDLSKHLSSKSTRGSSDPNWEKSQQLSRAGRKEKFKMRSMLIAGGLLFAAIVSGVLVLMRTDAPVVVITEKSSNPEVPKVTELATSAPETTLSILSLAESLAKQFLEAKTVDDLLPIVRNPEAASVRMKDYYAGGRVQPAGLVIFNSTDGVVTKGNQTSVHVTTRDQGEKQISFVKTSDGLKVDWESWVGWSELPWDKFLATKPTTGHLFRVILSNVDYYNFDFSDESKWRSYRLESPDREHGLYGYVQRDSESDKAIRLNADQKAVLFILSLKFPLDSKSNSQVEIDRVVSEGWVK